MLEVFCDFPTLLIAPTAVHLKCDVVVDCEDSVDVSTVYMQCRADQLLVLLQSHGMTSACQIP